MDNGDKGQAGARDGLIDFGGYATEQLVELESSIDPERSPRNHARLVEELNRRKGAEASNSLPRDRWDIQFSHSESFWSWVQAKRRRQWFYGRGVLEIQPAEIVLSGWQRTWLGMPVQGEQHIAPESIRNVGRDDATVVISVAGWAGSVRKLEFDCASVELALSLCGRLPPGRDSVFEREWQETRAFHRALYAPSNYPWGATALVLINVLVFLAFFFATKSWFGVPPQLLTLWGSNYGPLTVSGQWWRLLSSLFLHLSPLHLALNMWVLWNVGRLAERLFGHSVFLLLYFFTGIVAGLATVIWDPALNVVGSSGAIFGLLGAVLASVVRPSHRTPPAFVRSYWLSLLLFTLFNLVSGFLQLGIANAAHLGGLASGALLGAFIALPRRGDVEHRHRLRQVAAAVSAAVIVLLIALALTPGVGTPMAPIQQYWKSRPWLVAGEVDNLREWQLLLSQAQSGSISDDDFAQAFETKILPFWKSASERTAPGTSLPKDELAIARDVNTYAITRRDWAKAVVDAVRSRSSNSASSLDYYLQKTNGLAADLERRAAEANADLVSRALVRSMMIARIRRLLLPTPQCVQSSVPGYFTNSGDLKSDGPKRREAIGCSAQAAFRSGDFRALENLFAIYSAGYADPADGGSDRYSIQVGLDNLFQYGGLPTEEILVSVASWRRQYPDSVLPAIIEASAFTDWAWTARGHGYATSITQQQMQIFEYRNAMAEGVLDDIRARSSKEPLWYTLSVNVMLDLGKTRGEIKSTFEDGTSRFPNFLPLYGAEIRAFMPRWGGSYEKVDKLIEDAAFRQDSTAGARMYARLYWTYASLEGDDVDIFTDGLASWPRMSEGFDLLLKQYPDSDYLMNGYAYMACRAGDSEKYHTLKVRLRDRLSSTAWSTRYSPEGCDKKYLGNGV
jgi:membrane associated rhomboid family serine protease